MRLPIAAAALAVGLVLCADNAARAAPVEAYGALPSIDHVNISPDGSRIAYVAPDKDGHQGVVVASLQASKVLASMGGTDQKVRGLVWIDSNRLIVLKSQAGYASGVWSNLGEWSMAQVLDIEKHKSTPLLDADQSTATERGRRNQDMIMNVVGGTPEPRIIDGHPVVYVRGVVFKDSIGASALFAVDLDHHSQTRVDTGIAGQDRDWWIDAKGQVIAQTTYDEARKEWALRLRRGNGWVDAYSVKTSIDTPGVDGLSRDGALILRAPAGQGYEFKAVSLSDGSIGPAPQGYDQFDRLIEDPGAHLLIGGVRGDLDGSYGFFDKADQAAWEGIQGAFPGEAVQFASWSHDRRKVIVEVTGQAHGIAYVLVDLDAHKASLIADAYAGLKPEDVAGVETIAYKAADGITIRAFLTLPNGKDPKKLPLIVLPHGGPASRDGAGFDWWAQALASRGYAVLQPQFRGSAGFGLTLEQAGYGEFGRKMQTDLSDGVAALARAGLIDPKRVCIVGASYGGYAALAGVTLQSGIYRCAVSVAGLSDLRKFLGGSRSDPSQSSGLRYWDRFMGVKDPTDPLLEQISPIKSAAKLSAPLLLVHGQDDSVVPIEQSRRMADALKGAGKPFEFVTLKSEDHWLSRSETRQQMLQATVKFLEANNPPSL